MGDYYDHHEEESDRTHARIMAIRPKVEKMKLSAFTAKELPALLRVLEGDGYPKDASHFEAKLRKANNVIRPKCNE